jgi:hypothetical protein
MSPEDMAVDDRWTTLDDWYEYADEAVKRLTYALGLFRKYDASVAIAAGTARYTLPSEHAFTVLAWLAYAGAPVQMLRLSNVAQLFALDANWGVKTGAPTRLSLDAGGTGTATLYPVPVVNATLAQVEQYLPHTVAAGASDVPISPVCQDYLSYFMLATALAKESDHAKPEVAAHCAERCRLMEEIFRTYWGGGE